ncbi:hypothetical protein [Pseudomonas sp. EpS/L25]|uniref:hypothetical protein n=1 Tax=Pseudomonas sp. EpS/L25 TaxID=1749078 RepID=UPI00128F0180|nr:hypothetical protein [Pseudomonas sp. EpS/L25]
MAFKYGLQGGNVRRYETAIFVGAGSSVVSMAFGYPGWALAGGAVSLLAAILRPPRHWNRKRSDSREIVERVLARQAKEEKGKAEMREANNELES